MGRQRAENLHRDLFKEREGKRGKKQEQRSEQQVSEDRWADRKWRTYIGMSRKRERGREKKGKSTDLSNRSLKTNRETESGEPM
ncbi:hypothetical protein [Thiolapillus sp.]|uniref:hypothetical protein n=2 Tax=Thiolapillus sp. TaxID=2017437 RepID=UPI003AF8D382